MPTATTTDSIKGSPYRVIVNGKKALNGKRYSATYTGDIQNAYPEGENDPITIYEVVGELLNHIEQANREMEYPDAIQITVELKGPMTLVPQKHA